MNFVKRVYTCGELNKSHNNKTVVLNGWVSAKREHKSAIFIDISDRYGITQLVFESENIVLYKNAKDCSAKTN